MSKTNIDNLIEKLELDNSWIENDCNAEYMNFKLGEALQQIEYLQKASIPRYIIEHHPDDYDSAVTSEIPIEEIIRTINICEENLSNKIRNIVSAEKMDSRIRYYRENIPKLTELICNLEDDITTTTENQKKTLTKEAFDGLIASLNKDNLILSTNMH